MNYPTHNSSLRGALAFLVLAASGFLAEGAQATDSEAWAMYREYVAKCQTATSVEELLPYLPAWRHERHEASDEATRKKTFARLCKDAKELADIAFESEVTKEKTTTLQLKASWNDLPMKGKITLVEEDDGLKVDQWFWATGQ